MPKVIITCGKIGAGKSTYAEKFDGIFEEPERSEVDVWIENEWS